MQIATSRTLSPTGSGRLILALLLLAVTLTTQAGAPGLGKVAERFEHPERYRTLFERMRARGIPAERIREAFASDKALRRDERAVELRSEPARIPDHRADERRANERQLRQADILAEHLRTHADLYDRMEREYGVEREILGAVLLKESALGRYDAFDHDAFVVFNSLYDGLEVSGDADRRARMRHLVQLAREQLIHLVIYAMRRDLSLAGTPLPSSYAGAIGIPQFLPVHLSHAVDADGGDSPSLDHLPDAVLSAAHLIRNKLGWPDEPLDFARLENLEAIVSAWHRSDAYEEGFEAFRADMPNRAYVARYVKALKRYNPSSDYALGILRIAKRTHARLTADEGG